MMNSKLYESYSGNSGVPLVAETGNNRDKVLETGLKFNYIDYFNQMRKDLLTGKRVSVDEFRVQHPEWAEAPEEWIMEAMR